MLKKYAILRLSYRGGECLAKNLDRVGGRLSPNTRIVTFMKGILDMLKTEILEIVAPNVKLRREAKTAQLCLAPSVEYWVGRNGVDWQQLNAREFAKLCKLAEALADEVANIFKDGE